MGQLNVQRCISVGEERTGSNPNVTLLQVAELKSTMGFSVAITGYEHSGKLDHLRKGKAK